MNVAIGDKNIIRAFNVSLCEAYCPKPHSNGLIFDNIDEAFVIRKGFFFGNGLE